MRAPPRRKEDPGRRAAAAGREDRLCGSGRAGGWMALDIGHRREPKAGDVFGDDPARHPDGSPDTGRWLGRRGKCAEPRVRDARPQGRERRRAGSVGALRGFQAAGPAQLGTVVSCLTARAARPPGGSPERCDGEPSGGHARTRRRPSIRQPISPPGSLHGLNEPPSAPARASRAAPWPWRPARSPRPRPPCRWRPPSPRPRRRPRPRWWSACPGR